LVRVPKAGVAVGPGGYPDRAPSDWRGPRIAYISCCLAAGGQRFRQPSVGVRLGLVAGLSDAAVDELLAELLSQRGESEGDGR
ncbi:hypothetical protein, partial [Streptomyces sp. ID05-47C]|uniref:hypothetical protein n=1 Tax=Streptomyces sp. ID05-47C TaxID=3028665 RepID=UPI0029B3D8C3